MEAKSDADIAAFTELQAPPEVSVVTPGEESEEEVVSAAQIVEWIQGIDNSDDPEAAMAEIFDIQVTEEELQQQQEQLGEIETTYTGEYYSGNYTGGYYYSGGYTSGHSSSGASSAGGGSGSAGGSSGTSSVFVQTYDYDGMLEDAHAYNQELYEEGQWDRILDMESVQALDFDMRYYGFKTQLIGYVSIPKLSIKLPIYNNITATHLAYGAARLSSTSIPVGGVNTNCVICAHSGYSNPMFTYIGSLQEGDLVYVTNLWETLTYKVTGQKTIVPDDIDSIMIQEGKDMVTLMTCTPVYVNSHRLLVYCERVEESTTETQTTEQPATSSPEATAPAPSESETSVAEETTATPEGVTETTAQPDPEVTSG